LGRALCRACSLPLKRSRHSGHGGRLVQAWPRGPRGSLYSHMWPHFLIQDGPAPLTNLAAALQSHLGRLASKQGIPLKVGVSARTLHPLAAGLQGTLCSTGTGPCAAQRSDVQQEGLHTAIAALPAFLTCRGEDGAWELPAGGRGRLGAMVPAT